MSVTDPFRGYDPREATVGAPTDAGSSVPAEPEYPAERFAALGVPPEQLEAGRAAWDELSVEDRRSFAAVVAERSDDELRAYVAQQGEALSAFPEQRYVDVGASAAELDVLRAQWDGYDEQTKRDGVQAIDGASDEEVLDHLTRVRQGLADAQPVPPAADVPETVPQLEHRDAPADGDSGTVAVGGPPVVDDVPQPLDEAVSVIDDETGQPYDVAEHSIGKITDWIGDSDVRRSYVLAAERARGDEARTTLIAKLEP